MNIGPRLTLWLSGLVIFGIVVLLTVLIPLMTKNAMDDAYTIGRETAHRYSHKFCAFLETGLIRARAMENLLSSVMADPSISLTRDSADRIIRSFVENAAEDQIFSAYAGFEPDAFDGRDAEFAGKPGYNAAGRFMTVWYRTGDGGVERGYMEDYDTMEYYQAPLTTGKEHITEPYAHEIEGRRYHIVSLSVPLKNPDGDVIGMVGCDILLDKIHEDLKNTRIMETGFVSFVSEKGMVVGSRSDKFPGKNVRDIVKDEQVVQLVLGDEEFTRSYAFAQDGKRYLMHGTPIPIGLTGASWCAVLNLPMNEILSGVHRLEYILAGGIICLGAAMIALIFSLLKQVTRQIGGAVHMAEHIAAGDLTVSLEAERQDEAGRLADALNQMAARLDEMISRLRTMSGRTNELGARLSESAERISQGASEQAANTEEVAAFMEELSSSIQSNLDRSRSSDETAREAASGAREGASAMEETVSGMKEIAGKIAFIEEISRNTDLLALNAVIEAVRAGEKGRGFAVVAGEVRKFAERSREAATDITGITADGVALAEDTRTRIRETAGQIARTSELMQEITAAGNEQNAGMEQVNQALQQLDAVIQQNVSTSEDLACLASDLADQALEVGQELAGFRIRGTGADSNGPPDGFNPEGVGSGA